MVYKLQSDLISKLFSSAHTVISLIENVEKAIDNKIFICEVFLLTCKKEFDTVDHNILLHKLSYYGIRVIANYWFSSCYPSNRKQCCVANNKWIWIWNTKLSMWGALGSVLGPHAFFFLIYINDLHNAIKFSQSFHFAVYILVCLIQKTVSKINKSLNKDLKELLFWLNANKIASIKVKCCKNRGYTLLQN